MSSKSVGRFFIVAILTIHGFFLWTVRDRILRADPDFTSFYSAARIFRDGLGPELYDFHTQLKTQAEFSSNGDLRKGPLAYIHPPYEALLFVPLTFLSYPVAFTVWACLNLLILFVVSQLLRDDTMLLRGVPVWQIVVFCLAFFPVLANFHQGQDSILLLLIVVLAFRCIERGEEFAGGCWLGLGVFKYHLILTLALVLVIWRTRKLLIGFVTIVAATLLVSVGAVGWRGVMRYPVFVWHVVSEPSLGGLPFRRMPSLLGLIAGWPLTERIGWPVQIAVVALSLVLLTITLRLRQGEASREDFRLGFSCAVIMAVLLGYCTNTYDLSLLILPLALVADHWLKISPHDVRSGAVSVFPAAVICLSPIWFFLWMKWDRINLMAFFLVWWFFAIRSEVIRMRSSREGKKRLAPI